MKRVTITEIARVADVSMKTVSRVLNGEPNVREETRKRVTDAAKTLNYKPNFSARSLASNRSFVIVHFQDNPNSDYIEKIYRGMNKACRERGYFAVTEKLSRPYIDGLKDYLTRFEIDGLILSPPLADDIDLLDHLVSINIPFVRISTRVRPELSSYTGINDVAAMKRLTEKLISWGHQKMAFITGPQDHEAAVRREKGFLLALKDAGLPACDYPIFSGSFSTRTAFSVTEDYLKTKPDITAIIAANDDMAVGAMMAAMKCGLDVPKDLSIAGFDGSRLGEIIWPHLTTIHQPIEDMSATASNILLDEISNPELDQRVVMFDVELLKRGSTCSRAD